MLRFIIILILVYVSYRLLIRYVIPYFLKNYIKKEQEKFYRDNPNTKKEGEVHISRKPGGDKSKIDDDVGEYVDYEEIDE